jgi:hypothetical protein
LGVQIVEIDSDIIIEDFEILAISFECFFAILWQKKLCGKSGYSFGGI